MNNYAGTFTERGYRVVIQKGFQALPLNEHYTKSRNWHKESGRKQLALDLLIDAAGEKLATNALVPQPGASYENITSAWLPHLHLAADVLMSIAQVTEYNQWNIDGVWLQAWLDTWMMRYHLERISGRYHGTYLGMPFDEWSAVFTEIMHDFNVADVSAIRLGHLAQSQYYLAGYTPEGVALAWCKNLIHVERDNAKDAKTPTVANRQRTLGQTISR